MQFPQYCHEVKLVANAMALQAESATPQLFHGSMLNFRNRNPQWPQFDNTDHLEGCMYGAASDNF